MSPRYARAGNDAALLRGGADRWHILRSRDQACPDFPSVARIAHAEKRKQSTADHLDHKQAGFGPDIFKDPSAKARLGS